MKIALSVMLVGVLALAWRLEQMNATLTRQQQTITKQQQDIHTLAEAKSSQRDTFAMQEKCATQAEKVFGALGYKLHGSKDNVAEVLQSHFNPQLNKCFMTVETMDPHGNQNRFLLDAFEQREYGEYFWMLEKGTKYFDNPPKMCKEIPLSGDERPCRSDDEYRTIVKRYME